MVKSFKIVILNSAKAGRIKKLSKINGRQGFLVEVAESEVLFTLTTAHSQKTISKRDVELFVPLMLKGKGCKQDEDYSLEITDEN